MSYTRIWTSEVHLSFWSRRKNDFCGLERYNNLITSVLHLLGGSPVLKENYRTQSRMFSIRGSSPCGDRHQRHMDKKGIAEPERTTQLLKDVVISRIEPSSISEHSKFLYPSVYDMLSLDAYVPTLLLYRLDSTDPSAFSNFVHAVKNSFSQVLSFYYPMAGKWIVAEDAWMRKLVCSDEGAVFVEAAVDYALDDVLDGDDFKPPEELTGDHAVPGFEATSLFKTSKTKEYPPLIVQVTRFKCGGVALTLNFSHMTMDCFAFDRFLKAWSEILSTGQTSATPVFDRSMVVSHLDKSHILGISPDMENLDDVLSTYIKPFRSQVWRNDFTGKLFSIRKHVVERLRQKAREEHVSDTLEGPQRFTTFECVCAQLWRCFARIPKFLGVVSGEDIIRINFPIEGRRKWSNPPLSEDYVGNMVMAAGPPELSGSEVIDKPLSFAASYIHESIMKVNHETSGEVLDGMLKLIRERRLTQEKLKSEKIDSHNSTFQFTITSWSRFDNCYNLEFGYGRPFLFTPCPVWTAASRVSVFLLPPRPKSGNAVEMFVHAPLEYFSILLEDPEFIDLVS